MDSAGSDGGGRAAGAGCLDSLSDPSLASMPAAALVVHLYSGCRGADFADAALVLAARERRAADAEARIRAADETEARLRAEIRALQRRADEAEARARRLGWSDDADLEAGEIDPEPDELAAQDPAAAAASEEDDNDRAGTKIEADELDPDVDPDDKLTLREYLKKLKLLRIGGCGFTAESGSEESNTRRGNDDEWEKLRALAIVSSSDEALLAPVPPPLEVIPPGNDDDLLPNHYLRAHKMAHQGGGAGDDSELQNNVQGLSSSMAIMAWSPPVSLASKGSSPPVATHSEAGGISMKLDPSSSSMPRRAAAASKTRENGLFYRLVSEALKEKERSILRAKAAASPPPPPPQPNLRCWLFAPEPSESAVAVEDDPHGKAPQRSDS